jgi:hypothetical protein
MNAAPGWPMKSSLSRSSFRISTALPRFGENAAVIFTLSLEPVKVNCFALNEEQFYWFKAGLLRFNVYLEMCPPGEIRGQIIQEGETWICIYTV